MNFLKFKENVKQLLFYNEVYNEVYNEKYKDFIENYSVSTQAKYNHFFIQDKTFIKDITLVNTIVSLLDEDTYKMLFKID